MSNPGGAKAPRKPRITFKKQPIYDGMMRIAPSYHVNFGKQILATIQSTIHFADENDAYWFWYGMHGSQIINTAYTPKSLEDCKADIKKFFQDKL